MAARQGLTENCQFLLEHTGGSIATELDNQVRSIAITSWIRRQLTCDPLPPRVKVHSSQPLREVAWSAWITS